MLSISGGPTLRTVSTTTDMPPLIMPGSPTGKRKLEPSTAIDDYRPAAKRVSPFLNTPKARRDEQRRVLRVSVNKLRQIDDPEAFLRRSVLINNLARRMQKELRDEKVGRHPTTLIADPEVLPCARRSRPLICPPPSSPHPHSLLFDDTFSLADKITDDMSESLMRTVDALGGSVTSTTTAPEEVPACSVSPPSSTQLPLTIPEPLSSSIECYDMTEGDRQILGEMDAVFNSLLSVLAESVDNEHGS